MLKHFTLGPPRARRYAAGINGTWGNRGTGVARANAPTRVYDAPAGRRDALLGGPLGGLGAWTNAALHPRVHTTATSTAYPLWCQHLSMRPRAPKSPSK